MRVLVACEYSGVLRDAFIARGHSAISCDLLPGEGEFFCDHYTGDVTDLINEEKFDLMIGHPPCTDLAISGARWFPEKIADGRQQKALEFVELLMNAPIKHICIENPISVISSAIRKPDQIVQPWMFGDAYTKSTCLWLKNLPLLVPTNIVDKGAIHITKSGKRIPEWYNLPPSPDRWKIRSKTPQGLANAMADQWSNLYG